MRIYLDHNATTPLDPRVADAVSATLRDDFGNPSSVHHFGQRAKQLVDKARSTVASLIEAEPLEIVFTSGGTEADNLAIRGAADAMKSTGRTHLITSAIEHEAVLNTIKALDRQGWQTTLLPVDANGIVSVEDLTRIINDKTALVSVMHANNEIGTIQPITDLAEVAHKHGALFHTDAIQSVGKVPVSVKTLGADLLSLSAHKFNGPKGVGALWLKRGVRLTTVQTGGRHERNRRAGTENVPGLVGMGIASELAQQKLTESKQDFSTLRDLLEERILQGVSDTAINGQRNRRVPNTSNISFAGLEAESLLIGLDLEGVAVSTGSACSSGSLEPSHVLRAMGLPSNRVQSSIRFSLGTGNSRADIERLISILPALVGRLRALSSGSSRMDRDRRSVESNSSSSRGNR
ncbi:MAG TPA: cysteine desulfurase [Acidobacteria bacterium]|nr:cysteine desulfurase [Nitrospirales bacterium]HIN69923.1 cysteine desulfurase [Acidobacteriota bacterium]